MTFFYILSYSCKRETSKLKTNFLNNLIKSYGLALTGDIIIFNRIIYCRCPGHYKKDCPILKDYLFYLSLENAHCAQYMTEKVFYNAYMKGAIPVIAGPSLEDCKRLLPPNSFIHIDSFRSAYALAKALQEISKSLDKIWKYHEWRLHFKVVSEDGYFGTSSVHLCRVCEALNYNDGEVSIYDQKRLEEFFDIRTNCWETKKLN